MSTTELWSGRLGVALVLLVALVSFAPTAQDEGAPLAPGPEAEPSIVDILQSHTISQLEDGILASTHVTLTGTYLAPMTGEPVRVAFVATTYQSGQVVLSQVHSVQQLSLEDDSAVVNSGGPFDTGLAQAFAVRVLGGDAEAFSSYLGSGKIIPGYDVSVAPLPGLTWGAVTSQDDLDVTASVAP